MLAYDFQYDSLLLSDFGCTICSFDGSNMSTISSGSELEFTSTPLSNGAYFINSGARYTGPIQTEFDICKLDICNESQNNAFFTVDEQRDILRWLNRKQMLTFSLVQEGYENIYFQGSFNVSKIEVDGSVIGFHLVFMSNRPFGYSNRETYKFTTTAADKTYVVYDISDEIGYRYVDMVIKLSDGGDLHITNSFDGRTTIIKNCVAGEIITLKDMNISSSIEEHNKKIMNDFNFRYPRVCNSYRETTNEYEFSIPCDVELSYVPIVKIGI